MSERFDSSTHLSPTEATTQSLKVDDNARLRMLGYDAVLGRSFGFWSTAGISLAYMCPVDEIVLLCTIYAYAAPLVFIIGYPLLFILHMILLGVFAELATAYPVAGGMATWSWRAARAGVRNERQWGWFASGFVLAGHLGKSVSGLYMLVMAVKQLYIVWAAVVFNPMTMEAIRPKAWWNPVFHCSIVGAAAIIVLTRLGRNSAFWIGAGLISIFCCVFAIVLGALCLHKSGAKGINWGFPGRNQWVHSFSYMVFLSLPLRVGSIDAAAHMAEEIVSPERNIPRAMFASAITHFFLVYLTVIMYSLGVGTFSMGRYAVSPFVPVQLLLQLDNKIIHWFATMCVLAALTQVTAAVIVTSRFLFAMARDHAIPFANILIKTNQSKEPWVIDIVIIATLFAAVSAWYVNKEKYFNLSETFLLYFMAIPYALPLGLYLFSNLQLGSINRGQFTLGRWSKPFSGVALAWLCLSIIQGSFPLSTWNSATATTAIGDLSDLPFVLVGMLLVMALTWWLYGASHYVGPIRALTSWTQESDNKYSTAAGRAKAIQEYLDRVRNGSANSNGYANGHSNGHTNGHTGETSASGSGAKTTWRSVVASIQRHTPFVRSSVKSSTAAVEGEMPPASAASAMARTRTSAAQAESDLLPITRPTSQLPPRRSSDAAEIEPIPMATFSLTSASSRSSDSRPHTFGQKTFGTISALPAVPESQLDPTATDYGRVSHVHPWSSQIGAAMSITPAVPESQLDPTATADYSHLRH